MAYRQRLRASDPGTFITYSQHQAAVAKTSPTPNANSAPMLTDALAARIRANAYSDAAAKIHPAIQDYLANYFASSSSSMVSSTAIPSDKITKNGWALVIAVQASIDMVDKTLNGNLPTAEQVDASSFKGARAAINKSMSGGD